uniref:Integrase, catalytic region, zinc finger, CCHC-type, peptidase aspartic, catalytic n=1 Tax=Tanacetum cinerariifolium TaxID=118510 RepID=A0A6L2J4J4_TANCI|nr:integrase, catalytic region, zinc finger, CCHC-type, peptidase aspartic, catalytic [Tanacetum cinerariifolium]
MESYYTRFYKLMNEMIQNNLKVAMMQVNVQFIQQLQPKWSRSHTNTIYKGKEIAKPITPPSESASEEDNDPKQAQRDKDMQKNLALIAKYFKKIYKPTNNNVRTSSNSRNKNVDTNPQYKNENQSGQFGNQRTINVVGARENECRKPKRVKDFTYHKEKMLLCKQAEKGVSLQAGQYDWLADTDEEIDEQELEAHYSYMAKIQENDQNDVECDDECVALANLIASLKLDVDENKKIQKQLKKANTTLAQELKECKTIITKTSKTLRESNSVQDSCLVALQNKQTEFEKYKVFNDRTIDYDKLEHALAEFQCVYHHKVKECDCLAQKLSKQTESVSNEVHTKLLQRFAKVEKHLISLEIALQKCKEQIPKPSVLGKLAPFSDSLERKYFSKTKSVPKTNVSEGLSKIVTVQTLPQTARQATTVRSNQMKDKVVPNNRQVKLKKTQVEDHPRIPSISNANAVYATCGKCLVDSDHFAFVTKMLNDVNDRTKKPNIVQLILFIVDSGCTKHMTGNLKLLCNFIEKFLGTVRFGNDQFAPILGYGDLVQGNIMINMVYYVEGLNHNLFSVGQFCDADLKVAFWKSTCFVTDLQGNDLLTGNRGSDLYIISLQESKSSTPLCLMAKASPTQTRLWHRILSHLNFDYINLLSKKDVVIGLPKLKYVKNQLCSSCELSKAKRISFKSKAVPSSKRRLNLIHMDLCVPMRVASINGKKYILNGVVERRNHTLVEAARTMLSASKLPLFFWAEAIATACYTQNRSIIVQTHDKMAYHIINDRKPSIKHLHIFGCICYLTKDGENLDKIKEKGDPCTLVGYSTQSKGYHVYNKRARLIVESIHIRFDEIKEMSDMSVANDTSSLVPQRQKASDYDNSDPVPQLQNVSSSADAHVPS